MGNTKEPLLVGVGTVMSDLGVSRAKAYEIIKELNQELKAQYPRAIVISGKVNRKWYEESLMLTQK